MGHTKVRCPQAKEQDGEASADGPSYSSGNNKDFNDSGWVNADSKGFDDTAVAGGDNNFDEENFSSNKYGAGEDGW